MDRTWLIARHHFLTEARKRSFWILLFSLPLFLAFIVGFGILAESLFNETTTLGYVDPAGFLSNTSLDNEAVLLQRFETAEAAQVALDNETIAAYYLLAEDFETGRTAKLVYYAFPPYQAQTAFSDMVRRNHLADVPPAVAARVMAGSETVVRPLYSTRTYSGEPEVADFLPLFVALMFGFLAMTTSGYMMEALVAEKENRTMEIVVSSVSAGKLITGKILGALGIAAMQVLVWLACLVVALVIGRAAEVSWMMDIQPRWRDLGQMVLISLPVYFFLTAFFTMIGATLVESNEAQQVGPLILMVLLLPIYVLPVMMEDPNGPLALALSFFPPTAITAFALRMMAIPIPWWQVGVSLAISLLSAALMTWLAARAFREGMLRYGQRLRLGELFSRKRVPAGARNFPGN